MTPIDFGVQRSRSQDMDNWNWFPDRNCFPFSLIFMKLSTQNLLFLGSKGHRTWITKMISGPHLLYFFTFLHETWYTHSPLVNNDPYQVWGQRSRSHDIDNWKWFPDHIWLPFLPFFMRFVTKTTQVSTPINFRVRVRCEVWTLLPQGYLSR